MGNSAGHLCWPLIKPKSLLFFFSSYSRHSILPVSEMRFLRFPPSPLIQIHLWASVMQCPTLSWQMGRMAPGDLQAPVALLATWWSRPMTLPSLPLLWTLDLKVWSSLASGQWVRLEACWAPLLWWVLYLGILTHNTPLFNVLFLFVVFLLPLLYGAWVNSPREIRVLLLLCLIVNCK